MNPLPEFYEPVSEFEMWRDYREKRNRRAFYFLALLLILFIVASSLPSSDGPVFGTGNTQNNNQPNTNSGSGDPGADGQDGVDGVNGANGAPGPQGPAGANGSSSPSGGAFNGQAVIRVGACDSDITVSIKSRLVGGVFYFKRITFSDIHSSCFGSSIDVYLLDSSDAELASYLGGAISGSTFYFEYPVFELSGAATDVVASDIASVAIEIAE